MLIIDRFEENFVLCERDGAGMEKILKELVPKEAKEGDVLIFSDGVYVIDEEETIKRKRKIQKKFFDLFE